MVIHNQKRASSRGRSPGLLYLWVDIVGISNIIAPLINIIMIIPLNFLLNKLWVFK